MRSHGLCFTQARRKSAYRAEISPDKGNGYTLPTDAHGVPNQVYSKDYMRTVKNAVNRLAKQRAEVVDGSGRRHSLRAEAEREARYRNNCEGVEELKQSGVKLVVCSVHADCSPRCAPWQSRVYSLDGTRGVTEDGKRYVPLEEATDRYNTTKAGKTYKNGLLGFNCRHKLTVYKPGMTIPKVTESQRARAYEINLRQRRYETEIRDAKAQAELLKGIDDEEAGEARRRAKSLYKRYREFSKRHSRAFYPDRVTVI